MNVGVDYDLPLKGAREQKTGFETVKTKEVRVVKSDDLETEDC